MNFTVVSGRVSTGGWVFDNISLKWAGYDFNYMLSCRWKASDDEAWHRFEHVFDNGQVIEYGDYSLSAAVEKLILPELIRRISFESEGGEYD